MAKATFGAGCFWHVEAGFRKVEGVLGTRVGYAGGSVENPTYEDVCLHRSGHAEVVEVEFDPDKVSYGHLLAEFWTMHDPTQLNRQGPDIGPNYRSIIITHDDEQRALAEASKQALAERSPKPIVTEVIDAVPFWAAEDYHQQYFEKKGISSCAVTVMDPVS